jgi:hypothetical protein
MSVEPKTGRALVEEAAKDAMTVPYARQGLQALLDGQTQK